MNAKNLKKLYRNFAKELIGLDVKIKVDNNWWYLHTDQTIGVSNVTEDFETEEILEKFFRELTQKNYSTFTVGFLHELGHFFSKRAYDLKNDFFENCLMEVSTLNMIYNIDENFTKKRFLEEYYKIETERLANDFVALAVKSKPQVIEKYDKILVKIYG